MQVTDNGNGIAPSRLDDILVVEDMRALAIILARLLTKLVHHVEVSTAVRQRSRSYKPTTLK